MNIISIIQKAFYPSTIDNASRIAEDLRESQAKLEAILDNIVDGLIIIDEKGIIQSYNKACEHIFGYAAEDTLQKNVNMLMPEPYSSAHDQYLKNYMGTGHAKIIGLGRELEGRRKDGTVFPMDLSVAEVKLGGNKRLFSGIVRDVTERRVAEEALMRSNKELEKFAYIASHDLKAPLRNIDNLAQWVIEDTQGLLPQESRKKLDLLRDRIARLETLLEDILSYSRAGRLIDDPVVIDTDKVIKQIIQTHLPANFQVKQVGNFPVILSPLTPLEQIFSNLISNAVKHHDRKSGRIEIKAIERDDYLEFAVCDDGPGIPPEFHERVFQMFQTLKSRDQVAGSGLGMAIIKKLVEWQGGNVWIHSEAGARGTCVHFLWPISSSTKTAHS